MHKMASASAKMPSVDTFVGYLQDWQTELVSKQGPHALRLLGPRGYPGHRDQGVSSYDHSSVFDENAVRESFVGRKDLHVDPGGPQGLDIGGVLPPRQSKVDLKCSVGIIARNVKRTNLYVQVIKKGPALTSPLSPSAFVA